MVEDDVKPATDNFVTHAARTLVINGERQTIAATTVADVLRVLEYGDQKLATAVNGTFVPAAQRAETKLADGDRLEIVAPRQGG